ncbi:MAG TPA: adenosylhomocysteinase [Actinomycetota bacterium]|jgi:adenosylhomocysteinase|nr:adenosylhomocysteinase [Actinomycetota bacterium]
MENHVADPALAEEGQLRVEWALGQMPVISALTQRFTKDQPFKDIKIGACLHVTTETANLVQALRAGGAEVYLCASNPLSTQDDVAAYLASEGVGVFSVRGEDHDTYYAHIREILDREPHFTVDDGADLVSTIHRERPEQAEKTVGGTEETTTGVIRLRQMAAEGALRYPIVAINDTPTKHLFDNRFGTGQSALDGIIRATNVLVAGKDVVVSGYGDCGRGVASRAKGMGANVIVTEVDEVRALEAVMDGFRVMPMAEAARVGDIFITVTGDRDIIRTEHIGVMKDGAIISNAGHFDIEIDVAGLRKMASKERTVRRNVEEFTIDGKRIRLLAEGRLVNLGAAEGHPAAVMDMSFAGQALTLRMLAEQHHASKRLEPGVHNVPEEIDREIAKLKLDTMGVEIDTLTPEQRKYLESWTEGT